MIGLVCSHRYYLLSLWSAAISYLSTTKAFYHIATHTHTQIYTHTHVLASSPLCLAGMLMNEWTLVVIPYLCNPNTHGVFLGGGYACRVKPEELHLSPTTEPRVSTPWPPSEVSGCFSSVGYVDWITQSPTPPACPPECSASFIFALWGIFVRLNGFFSLGV